MSLGPLRNIAGSHSFGQLEELSQVSSHHFLQLSKPLERGWYFISALTNAYSTWTTIDGCGSEENTGDV
jgi:hypothetical protein